MSRSIGFCQEMFPHIQSGKGKSATQFDKQFCKSNSQAFQKEMCPTVGIADSEGLFRSLGWVRQSQGVRAMDASKRLQGQASTAKACRKGD